MELNAISRGRRHPANEQEKWMYNTSEMPWNLGDPSSDAAMYFLSLVGHEYGIHTFLLQGKRSQFYMDKLVAGY